MYADDTQLYKLLDFTNIMITSNQINNFDDLFKYSGRTPIRRCRTNIDTIFLFEDGKYVICFLRFLNWFLSVIKFVYLPNKIKFPPILWGFRRFGNLKCISCKSETRNFMVYDPQEMIHTKRPTQQARTDYSPQTWNVYLWHWLDKIPTSHKSEPPTCLVVPSKPYGNAAS